MTTTSPDVRGLEVDAYQQNGYFTSAQAREHGVSRQLLDHHVKQERFGRVRRGLYRIHGFPSSEHDDIREQWMAVGAEKAIVSHDSALALLGLSDNIPDEIHLLVPRRYRGLRRPPGVVIHTRPDDEKVGTISREGMPATTPARTLVDVADELQPEQVAMAVQQALSLGLVTRRQLQREAARQGKTRVLKTLLPER